jgi:hypothetical protein
MNLLPCPRSIRRLPGAFQLPARGVLHLPAELPRTEVMLPVAERLSAAFSKAGAAVELITGSPDHPQLVFRAKFSEQVPQGTDAYTLSIRKTGMELKFRAVGGLRSGVATVRQLLREYGSRLPCLTIRDWADFERRGVMLDISRGRVPQTQTLWELAEHLADFKINELQLYLEHTFAYRDYERVWGDWGALTAQDVLRLDAHCRRLGIELVPNQNSFGHLRYWLEDPALRDLAEVAEPYEGADGTFLRYPTTLAPNHPGTLPFLRGLYDELLPCFTSTRFNVGCDETWDLGRGQSRRLCERRGKGRVYLDFLLKIHREVSARGKQMMFWGDILLHYPELIAELPRDMVALNWGYEANHPFQIETAAFARSGVPFYVCPGTSTWMTLIGRHDNALENLRLAGEAGRAAGAIGYLNTDWGDGGHPQPLAVSYVPYLAGASHSWCGATHDDRRLGPVLSRDVFADPTGNAAKAAQALGRAHRLFEYTSPNVTPFGTVLTAPPREQRELFCRDGLKYYARIAPERVAAAEAAVEAQRETLRAAQPNGLLGGLLCLELDLAARMAIQSCRYLRWQQELAFGKATTARSLAHQGLKELTVLREQFENYWPLRNKGTTAKCSTFLDWRMKDYEAGRLVFSPDEARVVKPKMYAAE